MKSKSIYLLAILLCILAGKANATVAITGYQYICTGGTTTFVPSVSGGTWESANTSIATVDGSGVVTGGSTSGQVNITYTVDGHDPAIRIAEVNPAITNSTGGYVCNGTTSIVVGRPGGGTWVNGNTSVGTLTHHSDGDGSAKSFTGITSAGTAVLTYTGPTGCPPAHITMTVGLPAINGITTVCKGTRTILTCLIGINWTSNETAIADFLDAPTLSGAYTGISAGTTTLTFTYHEGCYQTAVVTIEDGDEIEGSPNVCVGQTTTLTHTTSGGTWYTSDASHATVHPTTGVVTGVAAGTARISYSISASCAPQVVVTVSSSPGAITGVFSVCTGQTTALSNPTESGTWSSSNTGIATVNSSGVVTGITEGNATITYSLGAGCLSTTDITVNATPTISGPAGVCNGYTATLTGTPGGGTWSSSNTSIATVNSSGVITGVSSGTAAITYMLSSGCFDTYVVTSGTSVAAISGPSAVCVGQSISMSCTPSGGTWSCTPKATVGASTGIVTGVSQGNTIITYTIGGTCKATLVVSVDNVAAINDSWYHDLCVDGDDLMFGGSSGGTWSSSNTAVMQVTATTGYISAISAGTATLTLTSAHAGCYDTHAMEVHDMPTVSGDLTLCNNHATTSLTTSSTITQWGPVSGSPAYISYVSGTSSTVKSNSSTTGTRTITYQFYNSAGCKVLPVVTVNSCAKASGQEGAGNPKMMSAGYTIVPNPSDGNFVIQNASASSGNDKIGVRVVNIIGQIVFDDNVDFNNGVANLTIKDALPGLYLLHITDKQGETTALRVVVE